MRLHIFDHQWHQRLRRLSVSVPQRIKVKGFRTTKARTCSCCSTRGITAGYQGYLNEAAIIIIIEYRASRVTVTGTVFALRDILRKSKDIIDRVVGVVGKVIRNIANQKRVKIYTGWIGGPCLFSWNRKSFTGSIANSREKQVICRVLHTLDQIWQIPLFGGN